MRPFLFIVAVILLATGASARGQDPATQDQEATMGSESEPVTHWNLALPTLGGKQFWTDLVHFHDYRIQQNAASGHCRLLDPWDRRLTWGNFAGCKQELDRIAREKNLPPVTGRVVIVLHGLSRTRSAMKGLCKHVASETGMQVINMSYASGRAGLEEHAAALESVIDHLPEVEEIHFVCHSLGNIVVRYYLGTRGHDPRFRRMVMLAPPNHGSALARWLESNVVFLTVTGKAGQQLAGKWQAIHEKLATPEFEFAIIAGSTADSGIGNPVVGGENDLVVGVPETRLAGARDFWLGHLWHSTLMNNREVQDSVVRFLEHGWLRSEAERQPITDDIATSPDAGER
jgi:hypothetical protein